MKPTLVQYEAPGWGVGEVWLDDDGRVTGMVEPREPRASAWLPGGAVVERAEAEARRHAGGKHDRGQPRAAGLGGHDGTGDLCDDLPRGHARPACATLY